MILSGRMPQIILPAGENDLGLGETIVSRDGIEVRGWIIGEGTPCRWTSADKETPQCG